MGLAASQARLLFLTSRKSDVEFAEMKIAQQKLRLSRDTEKVSSAYSNALNARKWVLNNGGSSTIDLTYGALMNPGITSGQYLLTNSSGAVVLSDDYKTKLGLTGQAPSLAGLVTRDKFLENMGISKTGTPPAYPASKYDDNGTWKTGSSGGGSTTTTTGPGVTGAHYKAAMDLAKNMQASGGSEIFSGRWDASKIDLMKEEAAQLISAFSAVSEDLKTSASTETDQAKKTTMNNTRSQIDNMIKILNAITTQTQESVIHDLVALFRSSSGRIGHQCAESRPDTDSGCGRTWTDERELSPNLNNLGIANTYFYDDAKSRRRGYLQIAAGWMDQVQESLGKLCTDDYGGYDKTKSGDGALTGTYKGDAAVAGTGGTGSGSTVTSDAKAAFYDNIYYAVKKNGWTANSVDLQSGISSGDLLLQKFNGAGGWTLKTTSDTDSPLSSVKDDDAIKKADSDYDTAKAEIHTKESALDVEMKRLDTERAALDTELDSVKSIIDKNIQRSFKYMS